MNTATGRLRGRTEGGVRVFKGIPYGASTADANRFRPPQPVQPWTGVRDAVEFGASAPQGPVARDLLYWYGQTLPINEDCLTLNVFTPRASTASRKPVMVWMHGGAWAVFASTPPAFHGGNLAKLGDVVVVTVNHRLNLFGHLKIDDGDERFADSGNAGVLDMVAALRWVRENVASFGGDPRNVTIFGQSGGAAKVSALMATEAARGLFHKVVAQSCSGSLRHADEEEATAVARALAAKLEVPRLTGEALQAIPMERLVQAFLAAPLGYRPILDGRTFTRHPFDVDAPPISLDIPLMVGNAASETRLTMASNLGNFSLDADEVKRRLARFLRVDAPEADRIMDAYRTADPKALPSDVLGAVTTDFMYIRNTLHEARLQSAAGRAPVYAYVFNWRTPVLNGVLHSPHTVECPFLFGNPKHAVDLIGATNPDFAHLTRMMIATWSAFAHTGNPNNPTVPRWQRYDPKERHTMVLDVRSRVEQDPGGQARAALNGLPFFEYSMPQNYARPSTS
ncbi:carboxylesterase/lipase family protein [Variovorax paradoxus]|nr:carboxylesterase family protein [Variovorax paradoxus]MBT2304868.1 carboxylesterase/lipase family protein [Variovorax paradoxus]